MTFLLKKESKLLAYAQSSEILDTGFFFQSWSGIQGAFLRLVGHREKQPHEFSLDYVIRLSALKRQLRGTIIPSIFPIVSREETKVIRSETWEGTWLDCTRSIYTRFIDCTSEVDMFWSKHEINDFLYLAVYQTFADFTWECFASLTSLNQQYLIKMTFSIDLTT